MLSSSLLSNRPGPEVASMYKVGFHRERVEAYLNKKNIFPVTLELDLTSRCTRVCPDCPSVRASRHYDLSEKFIRKLFTLLEGKTRGLLLTGGEPTASPLFPDTLKWAREHGFIDIAVVTNGSMLDSSPVFESLLERASTIRLSMYDWEKNICGSFESSLRKIELLRKKIDGNGSRLQIGISALTSDKRSEQLLKLAENVRSAGADWIYFHPLCTNWGLGRPTPETQEGVIQRIREIQVRQEFKKRVFLSSERYDNFPLEFQHYHAAHFLLVIGADGRNYLGPEVKYQPNFVIADLGGFNNGNLLWKKERFEKINSFRSQTYSAVKSRHRGVLYNHLIESLNNGNGAARVEFDRAAQRDFYFPHIL